MRELVKTTLHGNVACKIKGSGSPVPEYFSNNQTCLLNRFTAAFLHKVETLNLASHTFRLICMVKKT